MPILSRNDPHKCPFCGYSSVRCHLKTHLTSPGKKGRRCPGIKTPITVDVWVKQFIPHYATGAPLPDTNKYTKKRRGPKIPFSEICHRQNKKKRLAKDDEIICHGETRLNEDKLLELLHHGGDADMRWLVDVVRENVYF